MSEEKTELTGLKALTRRRIKGKNRILKWFREMRSEMKKVVWPTPRQVAKNTMVALTVMVIAAIAVWALDQVGMQIFQAIITLGGKQ